MSSLDLQSVLICWFFTIPSLVCLSCFWPFVLACCLNPGTLSLHSLAVGALASLHWCAIEISSVCHPPARLPVGSSFLCSPSCSACPPASFYVLVLLSCKIRTGNTQKFVLVKTKVKPQHSEGQKCVQIVPSHGQQRHLSFILQSLNEKAESEGASAISFLHLTLPSEPCGELGYPASGKVSLTFPLLG